MTSYEIHSAKSQSTVIGAWCQKRWSLKMCSLRASAAKAGTSQQASGAGIVRVALRWVDAEQVLGSLPDWRGRIVIDGTNPVEFIDPASPEAKEPGNPLAAYGIKAVDPGASHSSQISRQIVPGARVVKAFNHLDVNVLNQTHAAGGQRVLF